MFRLPVLSIQVVILTAFVSAVAFVIPCEAKSAARTRTQLTVQRVVDLREKSQAKSVTVLSTDDARALLNAGNLTAAQDEYEKLLQNEKTAENYAGLAEALILQDKLYETNAVLTEAKKHDFANTPNILAIKAQLLCRKANTASMPNFSIFMDAAVSLCKRALVADPKNKNALITLENVRSKRLKKAREMEANGDLFWARLLYEDLLKEKKDDVVASAALDRIAMLQPDSTRDSDGKSNNKREFSFYRAKPGPKEIPAGTTVSIAFDTPLNCEKARIGNQFFVQTVEPIAGADGYVVLQAGAKIRGTVTDMSDPTKNATNGHSSETCDLQIRFDGVVSSGALSNLVTASLVSRGGTIARYREGSNLPIATSAVPIPSYTWLCSKKGDPVDVRVGDRFLLEFSKALLVDP